MSELIPTEKIIKVANETGWGGGKTPHRLSSPVLRSHSNECVLAFFIFTFTLNEIKNKQIKRPNYWFTANIIDGTVLDKFICKEYDFSQQSFDMTYSIASDNLVVSREYYDSLYEKMDDIRKDLILNKHFNESMYSRYMKDLLEIIPQNYRIFYKELSNIQISIKE